MEHIIVGIVALIVGLYLMLYRERFARYVIKNQNRTLGFKFADNKIKSTKIISLITGFFFIVFGMFLLLAVINFK